MQDIRRLDRGGGAVFDAELHIDLFQMLVDRAGAQAQDFADVAVRFALGDPEQHLGFAHRQRKILPQNFVVAGLADAGQAEEEFVAADRAEIGKLQDRLPCSGG